MTLGEVITEYRISHNISGRTFAKLSGLSNTYIATLEKGITPRGDVPIPSIETYKSVASAMGLSLDELIRKVDDLVAVNYEPEESLTDSEMKLIQLFRMIPEEDQPLVLGMIRAALNSKGLL